MKLFTCEQVSWGHPDKICDRISDAIINYCIKNDSGSRCAVETMIKGYNVYILGELTTKCDIKDKLDGIVRGVLRDTLLESNKYNIILDLSEQSCDIALGTNDSVGGAGDQGMMFGYATSETKEMLPIPYILATKALEILKDKVVGRSYNKLLADAKSQVTFDYDNNRIVTFLISTQHTEDISLEEVKELVKDVMVKVAKDYNLNTDFEILVNPTGKFVVGSSFADSGLTGRKIIADTYGGMGHHGGGAFSGKDPTKVDRSGAYIARNIAKNVIRNGLADKCEVQIAYAIGVPEPVSVLVDTFGTNKIPESDITDLINKYYDLTPKGIEEFLRIKDVDLNHTSSYGHFTKGFLPWECKVVDFGIH